MSNRMLIDASHAEETRVAIVSGNRVEDFDFEAANRRQLKGNIYLAKVTRVEPSLQAAFVDYGGNRHGFLAFSEIHPDYYQIPVADREALIAEEREAVAEEDKIEANGNDKATARDSENGENGGDDVESVGSGHDDLSEELPRRPKNLKRRYKIQEVIRRRQILLVQVVKEERGNKGAALTTYLSLAGRYCVLMPNTHHGGGISRKIANPGDRRKLKETLKDLNLPDGMACIIRTAGLSRSKTEIKRDFDYLRRMWDEIREQTLKSIAPALIYGEGDLIKRAIRDLYDKDIEDILVEGEEGYKSAKGFMRLLMPSHAKKVKHYKEKIPLFHRFQVEDQLDSMFSPTVQLKSGGYIVINPAEALVAIDVNSGKATREHNIEETALKTNLEAAAEVARQLRLRDMAGLIVIDFIDMEDRNNNRAVERKLKECLKADRARIQVGRISAFGLLEMSRQRLRPGVLEASTMPCTHCEGTGIVRSVESSALHLLRAIEEEGIRGKAATVHFRVAAPVALYILNQKRNQVVEIESRYGFQVLIEVDDTLIAPKFNIERESDPRPELPAPEDALPMPVSEPEDDEDVDEDEDQEEAAAPVDSGARDDRKRRRKRRRRKPGDRVPAADEESPDAAAESESEDTDGETAAAADGGDTPDGQPRKRRRRGRRGGRRRARVAGEGEDGTVSETGNLEAAPPEDAEPVAEGAAEAPVEDSVATEEPETAPAPAPARTRTRRPRKTAKSAEVATGDVGAGDVPPGADTATEDSPKDSEAGKAEKPERPRRRKAATKPAADAEVAQPVTAAPPAEPGPEPQLAPAREVPAEPAAAANAAPRHAASAPVKVVDVNDTAPEADSKPSTKKGWWQRAFGN